MYLPPYFEIGELSAIQDAMEARGLANFVTWTGEELLASALPLMLVRDQGEYGTLYGHFAKVNDQWNRAIVGEALAIFSNVDAYITPSWYATKAETGRVVPTWNYEAVHAYGVPEFFHDEARLLNAVTALTRRHESERSNPWKVSDAPAEFIRGQLRGIVGFNI